MIAPPAIAGLPLRVDDLVAEELSAVEKLLADELRSDVPCVNALVRHVGRFRGKMLRPRLLLLAGKAVGSLTEAHVVLATVVEMVHLATLVHDDVLDEAELRRRSTTINHLRGNEAAVLLGDYLISHSYHLCSSLDSQWASRLIARTTNRVCEGELLQIDSRNRWDLSEATYLQIISAKTASLCAACCELGARFAGASDEVVARLATFGQALGMAFQIQDDILDLEGDVRVAGKSLGTDIEKGKLTLPLIHFARYAPREHQALLRSLLESGEADKVERVRQLVLPTASMQYARNRARGLARQAIAALGPLPATEARQRLEAMADFAVARAA
jgi:octaprenyl-diphosphate synthase